MKIRTAFFCVLVLAVMSAATVYASEYRPEGPDPEPLYEDGSLFVGRLDDRMLLLFGSNESGADRTVLLDRQQAIKLTAYARKVREIAPDMDVFRPLGDGEVPVDKRPVKPLDPAAFDGIDGEKVWVRGAGTAWKNGSFVMRFTVAPAGSDGKADKRYLKTYVVYERRSPIVPGGQTIDKETGQLKDEPNQQGPTWGPAFMKLLSGLEKFAGSKVLIGG